MKPNATYDDFVTGLIALGLTQEEIFRGDDVARYNRNTFPSDDHSSLVLKPHPRSESLPQRYQLLLDIVTLAKKLECPLYPISTGKNWGYGSAVPTAPNACLLDLSLFNKISQYFPQSHQITVEPGVTQEALHRFLLSQGDHHWMDATGGPLQSSVLGNTLEWGFGHSPKGEHGENVLNLTVLVPYGEHRDAEIVSTGLRATINPDSAFPRPVGLGPEAHGLFLQSDYGVVLNMTLSLLPKPEAFSAYFIDLQSNQLPDYIDLARTLRANGVVHSASHIGNDHKAIQMALKFYPYKEAGGKTPLPVSISSRIKQHFGIADWTVSGGMYGTQEQVEANIKAMKRALASLGLKAEFINHKKLAKIEKLEHFLLNTPSGRQVKKVMSALFRGLGPKLNKLAMLEDLKALFHLKCGIPTDHFTRTIYFRSGLSPDIIQANPDPNDVNAGFIWVAPGTRLDSRSAIPLAQIVERQCEKFGFEPTMSVTLLNQRAAECVVSISFDRSKAEEEQRAMACHDAILMESAKTGDLIYRLSVASAHTNILPFVKQAFPRLDLKTTFDPKGIISPGRYRNIYVS